jgi:hypothetical protein
LTHDPPVSVRPPRYIESAILSSTPLTGYRLHLLDPVEWAAQLKAQEILFSSFHACESCMRYWPNHPEWYRRDRSFGRLPRFYPGNGHP